MYTFRVTVRTHSQTLRFYAITHVAMAAFRAAFDFMGDTACPISVVPA